MPYVSITHIQDTQLWALVGMALQRQECVQGQEGLCVVHVA